LLSATQRQRKQTNQACPLLLFFCNKLLNLDLEFVFEQKLVKLAKAKQFLHLSILKTNNIQAKKGKTSHCKVRKASKNE